MIVVVGATGSTGTHLVTQLMKAGRPVRAVVRNRQVAEERFGKNAEIAIADLTERKVAFVDVPGAAFQQAMVDSGAPKWFAEFLTDVYVKVYAGRKIERISPDVESLTKKRPRTLADFVRENRAAFS